MLPIASDRYTGLTVEDRWRGTGSHGISQLKELLLPFGYGGAEGRELLHDKGDAVLEAFAAAVGERKKEASQGFAFLAPQVSASSASECLLIVSCLFLDCLPRSAGERSPR